MQDFRQNGDEGAARLGRQEIGDLLGFFPFRKPGSHQLFQDGGAGGRSADTLPLCILWYFTSTGGLHALEDGVLREMLGRGCFALLHLDGIHRQRLALGQSIRQGGILGGRGISPPAHIQRRFPFDGEVMPTAVRSHNCLGVPIGRADRPDQRQRHQPQKFSLSQGERGEVNGGGAGRGNNRVMVGNFFAAAYLGR